MVKCSKCGVEIKEDDKYCPNCGTANINAVKKMKKNNRFSKTVLVLIIVLLLVALLLSLFSSKELEDNNEEYNIQNELQEFLESTIVSPVVTNNTIQNINLSEVSKDKYDVNVSYFRDTDSLLYFSGVDSQFYIKETITTSSTYKKYINDITFECSDSTGVKYYIYYKDFNNITLENIDSNTTILDSNKNIINTTVEQEKANYITNYKNSCQTLDYDTIFRYAEDYEGQRVKYTGKVVQVIDSGLSLVSYRVNVTQDEWGFYDDTVYVNYFKDDDSTRILEDDIITFYGTLSGLYTYETVLGTFVTIPEVSAEYIDINM